MSGFIQSQVPYNLQTILDGYATTAAMDAYVAANSNLGTDPNVLARLAYGKTIYVDPATGDDSQFNDGSVTPLKSLDALLKRLPVYGSGVFSVADPDFNPIPILVELAAGDYTFERDNFGSLIYLGEAINMPTVLIRGATTSHFSFQVDHYANSCHVYQAAGNPAWTVNEWTGMFLKISFDYGPPYGVISARYPILANGTDDLTVGWSPNSASTAGGDPNWYWPYTTPAPGDTVEIVELASHIIGPTSLNLYGFNYYFKNVHFDGVPNSMAFLIWLKGATVEECRFSGSSNGSNFEDSTAQNCLFDNVSSGIRAYSAFDGSNLSFLNISGAGIGIQEGTTFTYYNSCFHAPDAPVCMFAAQSRIAFDGIGVRANAAATLLRSQQGRGPNDLIWKNANPITALEAMLPATWLEINSLDRFLLDGNFNTASGVPANAFRFDGNTLNKSVAQWIAAGKDLSGVRGGRLIIP